MANIRVPVVNSEGRPLMPTTASRARRWLRDQKAKIFPNDLGIFAVQLLDPPSGYNTQSIACGIDPGSDFTGIAVQSEHETLQGLNLNLPRKQVSKRMVERAVLRRTRRGRRIKRSLPFKLRNHRSKRFDNRRQSRLPPSIRANKQLELRVVRELEAIYPITHFYVEKLTKSDTPAFTRAAQGQTYLLLHLLGLGQVVLVEGWETSNTRQYLELPKSKNKGEQSPAAHVNDAIALASRVFIRYAPNTTGTQTGYLWKGNVQVTNFDFATVERLPSRPRKMHDLTIQKGGKRRSVAGGSLPPQTCFDKYGGFQGTHSYNNGDVVQYKTKRLCFTGIVSANDLYQFFPKKKRLKQGITDTKSRLIKRSCNLLVNHIKRAAFLSPLTQ